MRVSRLFENSHALLQPILSLVLNMIKISRETTRAKSAWIACYRIENWGEITTHPPLIGASRALCSVTLFGPMKQRVSVFLFTLSLHTARDVIFLVRLQGKFGGWSLLGLVWTHHIIKVDWEIQKGNSGLFSEQTARAWKIWIIIVICNLELWNCIRIRPYINYTQPLNNFQFFDRFLQPICITAHPFRIESARGMKFCGANESHAILDRVCEADWC